MTWPLFAAPAAFLVLAALLLRKRFRRGMAMAGG
jgi:cytochrome c-type biogenesis protein CcmH